MYISCKCRRNWGLNRQNLAKSSKYSAEHFLGLLPSPGPVCKEYVRADISSDTLQTVLSCSLKQLGINKL
jgi:hypothetical protein